MDRKDPLEGSLLGSGWKACIHAHHLASSLPAGRSLSSQMWPGLYLSWAEVPSFFFLTPRLKPQLKHEIEQVSSKLYPVWGYHNLWHPVTFARRIRIWRREENHFCITPTDTIWLSMKHKNIYYICKQCITVCVSCQQQHWGWEDLVSCFSEYNAMECHKWLKEEKNKSTTCPRTRGRWKCLSSSGE